MPAAGRWSSRIGTAIAWLARAASSIGVLPQKSHLKKLRLTRSLRSQFAGHSASSGATHTSDMAHRISRLSSRWISRTSSGASHSSRSGAIHISDTMRLTRALWMRDWPHSSSAVLSRDSGAIHISATPRKTRVSLRQPNPRPWLRISCAWGSVPLGATRIFATQASKAPRSAMTRGVVSSWCGVLKASVARGLAACSTAQRLAPLSQRPSKPQPSPRISSASRSSGWAGIHTCARLLKTPARPSWRQPEPAISCASRSAAWAATLTSAIGLRIENAPAVTFNVAWAKGANVLIRASLVA